MVRRNFRNFDTSSVQQDIDTFGESFSQCAESKSVEDLVVKYKDDLINTLDKHAPLRPIIMKGNKSNPWYNNDIDVAGIKDITKKRCGGTQSWKFIVNYL